MAILACPNDHGDLKLVIESQEADDIVAGTLTCEACGENYPIVDSIPNLLPTELRNAGA
jgi:uncharacterized protein YbaR (Trm112 family)